MRSKRRWQISSFLPVCIIVNGKRKKAVRKVVIKNNKNVDKYIFCALIPTPLLD
jgi:hypothetical protein